MIYIIDHNDSFTHNVVHQFENFDEVVCTNFNIINENKLKKSDIIVFSPGPGDKTITDALSRLFLFILLKLSHSTLSNKAN